MVLKSNHCHGYSRGAGQLCVLVLFCLFSLSSCATHPSAYESAVGFEAGANIPPTPKTLYAMARILTAQGKIVQSEIVLNGIIRRHPVFLPAYTELADLQTRDHRANDAIKVLSLGLEVSPENPIFLNDLGMCLMLKRDYGTALKHFTEAAGIMLDNVKFRGNLAVALGMLGRYDECLAVYEQIVPSSEAHYNLGVLCEARQDFRTAHQEFRRARARTIEE